jgi:hypothetical protein
MKGVVICILFLLFLTSNIYAFSAIMTSSDYDIVYPNTKEIVFTVTFQKGSFDSIEDIDYKVIINGPASFSVGGKEVSNTITQLDKTKKINYTLNLEDTESADFQSINIQLTGTYVSNALFGGGKKDISENLLLKMISTEKSKAIEEADEMKKAKEECEQNLNKYVKQCSDDKSLLQSNINDLNSQIVQLQAEKDALNQNLSSMTTQGSTTNGDSCSILGFPLIGIIIILAFVIWHYKKKSDRLESHLRRQHP